VRAFYAARAVIVEIKFNKNIDFVNLKSVG
jgi:hypothetical protein